MAFILHPFPLEHHALYGRRESGNARKYLAEDGYYVPRVYAKTWSLVPRIKPGVLAMPPMFGPWTKTSGISPFFYYFETYRYTSPTAIIHEARRLGCTATWNIAPELPFWPVDLTRDIFLDQARSSCGYSTARQRIGGQHQVLFNLL